MTQSVALRVPDDETLPLNGSVSRLGVRWFAALTLHVSAILFCLVSLTTGFWLQGDLMEGHVTLGLWTVCLEDACLSVLSEEQLLNSIGVWIISVQACAVTGIVLLSISFILSIAVFSFKRTQVTSTSLKVIAVITCAGGVLFITSLLVFALKVMLTLSPHSGERLRYSSAMMIGLLGGSTSSAAVIFYALQSIALTNHRSGYMQLK